MKNQTCIGKAAGVGIVVCMLMATLWWLPTMLFRSASGADFTLTTGDGLSVTLDGSGAVKSLRLGASELATDLGGFRVREISRTIINRAPNPGFEQGSSAPVDWTLGGPDWLWDSTVYHSGRRSVRLVVPPPVDQLSSNLRSSTFPLLPDTSYDFSVWVRAQDVGGSFEPAIRFVELDAAGNVLRTENNRILQHALDIPHGTYEWRELRRVFRTRSDCRQGYIYANIFYAYGTIWLDDVNLSASLGESPEVALSGTVTQPSANVLVHRANLANAGLNFTATYTAHPNHLRIDGEIQDRRLVDRGMQISFTLPMDAVGWVWGDDIRNGRTVRDGIRYENTQLLPYGGTFSRYPFSSLSGPPGGLSLAVPMDVPRIQYTSYEKARGYQMVFDLAVSPATTKLGPGRATFSLVLYRYDSPWGFRAAAAKYYAIFPHFFTKRVRHEGLWIGGVDPAKIPNVEDFRFAFNQDGQLHLLSDSLHNIQTFQYLEPWGWWRFFSTNPEKPSYQERMNALLQDATAGNGTWEGAPLQEVAQSVLNTAPWDAAGRYYLDASDHFWHYWGAGIAGYYQNYPTNPDPELPMPNRGRIAWDYELGRTLAKAAQLNFIDHWTFGLQCRWDSIGRSGSRSAQIVVPTPTDKSSGYWQSEPVAVNPNTGYTLSAWVKAEALEGVAGAGFFAVELDAQGEPILPWTQHDIIVPRGTYNWTRRSVSFVTSSRTRRVFLYGAIWQQSAGKVWFDDVELRASGVSANLAPNPSFEQNRRGDITDTSVAGAYLDSLHVHWAWSTLEDYRRDHLTVADHPPVFSYATKQPVLLGFMTHYDFVDWLSNQLRAQNRLLMGNVFYDAYNFFAHHLDVLGSEIAVIDDDTRANLRRTLSYQKPNSNLMQWHLWEGGSRQLMTRSDVEAYIKASLFYAFFPSIFDAGIDTDGQARIYWRTPALYERDRDLFRYYVPIIQTIARAGWEPVTQAWTDNNAVWVERYGPEVVGASRQVYFTVRNATRLSQSYTLTIDFGALGANLTPSSTLVEIVSGANIPFVVSGGQIRTTQTISSGDTKVFRLTLGL